jgi:hypothetical protein
MKDQEVMLEIAPKVIVRYERSKITSVIKADAGRKAEQAQSKAEQV